MHLKGLLNKTRLSSAASAVHGEASLGSRRGYRGWQPTDSNSLPHEHSERSLKLFLL